MKKINVLQFICSTGFYGAERWVLALSKHLDDERFHSELAITLEDNSRDLTLVREWQALPAIAHELPMRHRFDWGIIAQLVDLIKARNIDVIHTHGYKSDILGVIAAKQAKIAVVVTPHGFENAQDWKLRAFIWLGCQAMRFADRVVPLSPALVDDVKRYGISEPQLCYIQNGVDLSEVEAVRDDASMTAETAKLRIGFIGQMISRKNIDSLLRVFAQVHQRLNGQVELVLLGDGESRAHLEQQAQQARARDDIHFLGFRDDRLALLKTFDLFVMTSTLEGIPRCLMEACAMGIPVAAYDIDGVDQLISHEKTGLLAPLGDEKMLAQHWCQLLNEPDYARELATAGVEFVNTHFSAARMADEYATLFSDLVTTVPEADYAKA
jgi:glycosyltransferase involved in cell wall biosynthesis